MVEWQLEGVLKGCCQQISGTNLTRCCLLRSLCIIDEFGKGTLAADGIGLFCSTLMHLGSMQPPPKVVACTHFSEVFQEAYLARSVCKFRGH